MGPILGQHLVNVLESVFIFPAKKILSTGKSKTHLTLWRCSPGCSLLHRLIGSVNYIGRDVGALYIMFLFYYCPVGEFGSDE